MNAMNKPPKKEPEAESPIARAAKKSWNEAWGPTFTGLRTWQCVTVLACAVAAYSFVHMEGLAGQVKVVPLVVQVNQLGEDVVGSTVIPSAYPDVRVVKAELANWIWNSRSVYGTQATQLEHMSRAYPLIEKDSPADKYFVAWMNGHADRESAKSGTVQVKIESVYPEADSWRINWSEQKFGLDGSSDGQPGEFYAIVSLDFAPSTQESAIRANPMGLYIKTLEWGDRPAQKVN
jgi:type IV secretion system protein TrbF